MLSTRIAPDVIEYLDSGKIGARQRRRRADSLQPAWADPRLLGRRGLAILGDMVRLLVTIVLYVLGIGFFRWLGGVQAAGAAIERWGARGGRAPPAFHLVQSLITA